MKKKIINFLISELFLFSCLIYLVFLVFRIINGNFHFPPDSHEYLEVSQYLKTLDYFTTTNIIVSKRPVGYPLFLLLSFGYNFYVIVFLQAILLFSSLFLFQQTLNHFQINITKSKLYLVVFTPSLFIYSQLILTETLVLFLLSLLFYIFIVNFNWKNLKYTQIILVFLAFTKPVFYPFVLVNLVLMLVYFYKVKKFSFWVFLPLISVVFLFKYNEEKFGYKHYSSIENYNLINYNLYYFKSFTQSKKVAENWLKNIDKNTKSMKLIEKEKYLKNIGKQEISNHFISYSIYHSLTGIRGIIDPGRFDFTTFFKREDGKQGFLEVLNGNSNIKILFTNPYKTLVYLLLIPVFFTLFLKVFWFVKYFFSNTRTFFEYYFLILICYYVLITGPVNCSRYMMPLQLITLTFVLLSIKENTLKNANKNQSNSFKCG